MEIRKDIEWLNWEYQVSNYWNIRSIKYWWKITNIKLRKDHWWYLVFKPSIHCKRCDKKVHRVVAEAFIPKIDWKNEINHKDWNKENNRVDNLEWSNRSENNKHWYDMWLKKQWVWINNPFHREIYCLTKDWEFVKEYWAIREAERDLWVSRVSICNCCRWVAKTAGWYKWKYKD